MWGKRFLFFLTSDSERTVVVRAVGLPGGRRPGPAPSQWLPETGTVQLGPSWRSAWRSAGERAMRRCQGVSLYISLYNAYMLHFINYSGGYISFFINDSNIDYLRSTCTSAAYIFWG